MQEKHCRDSIRSRPDRAISNGRFFLNAPADGDPGLMRRLEQLERVSVRIEQLNLLAAGTRLHLVSEANSGSFQCVHGSREIGHLKHDAIPATGLLRLTVRHRARARSTRTAQRQSQSA